MNYLLMKEKQSKITDFFKKFQHKAPPRKVLLRTSGVKGILAEQGDGGKIRLLVEDHGRHKLIATLDIAQYKEMIGISPLELSPNKLKGILPKMPDQSIFLLNEALINLYRERKGDLAGKAFEL